MGLATAATLAASAIGAHAASKASSKQASAINNAANQQAQSSAEQIALQREARDEAKKILTPYVTEGDSARRMLNSAYGVAPTGEGDSLEGARADFDAGFEASPFWKNAQDATAKALAALRSTNAALGRGSSINSGKAMRAAADINQNYRGGATSEYIAGLGGIADRGFDASAGIASGGVNFANSASSTMAQSAANQGNLAMAAANAKYQGASDAAGFLGWGAGQLSGGNFITNRSYFNPSPAIRATPLMAQPISQLAYAGG